MATKRKVSNPLALAVMALLYERPMHPYEMVSLMREPVKEYTQFAAGLSFLPGLPPEEAVALLKERVLRLEEETEEMRSRIDSAMEQFNLPRLFLVESEHELMLREAELGWVRG